MLHRLALKMVYHDLTAPLPLKKQVDAVWVQEIVSNNTNGITVILKHYSLTQIKLVVLYKQETTFTFF